MTSWMFQTNYITQTLGKVQGQFFKTTSYAFNTRGKKLAWLALFLIISFLYLSSSRFMPVHRHIWSNVKQGKRLPCLQREIEKWHSLASTANVVINDPSFDPAGNLFLPFTGNGYIGMIVDGKSKTLHLLNNDQMPIEIPVVSLIQIKLKDGTFSTHDAVVLNLKEGVVHLYRAYSGQGSCVLLKHTVYAHRRHSGIIVQELTVSNLLEEPITVELEPISNRKWTKSVREELSFQRKDGVKDTQLLFHGYVNSDLSLAQTYAAISVSSFPKMLAVPVKSFNKVDVLMMVASNDIPLTMSTPASKSEERKEKLMNNAIQASKTGLRKVLSTLKPSALYQSHVKAWNEVWELGLSVESKDDPDSPSPVHVNLTEYYIYSVSTLGKNGTNDIDLTAKKQRQLDLQSRTGSCFYGSPTMYAAEHWVLPRSIKGLMALVKTWTDTFEKYGCGMLLQAGLFGWQEAIALSFSGLQFTERGLELALNPLSLASNVSVRHLPCFMRQLFLQIVIDKPHDVQKLQLSSYGPSKIKLYACDAGCEHISELKTAAISFKIRVTSPVTPILYVSPNKTKLELIKKSKFIVMSKEDKSGNLHAFAAHHFKLSPKFWFAVGILIAGFHVIVIKMIYNECRKDRGRRSKGRTFVS